MENKKKTIAKKMTSKTYSVSRCGSCNRFGHSHSECERNGQDMKNNNKQQNFHDGPSNSRY